MSERAFKKIRDGLIEALRDTMTEVAQFQFNAGIFSDGMWIPHVSDAEELEADLVDCGIDPAGGRYPAHLVQTAIPFVVSRRLQRTLARLELL